MPCRSCTQQSMGPLFSGLKGHNIVVIRVKKCHNELMVEIYFKGLVRAIGQVLRMIFS